MICRIFPKLFFILAVGVASIGLIAISLTNKPDIVIFGIVISIVMLVTMLSVVEAFVVKNGLTAIKSNTMVDVVIYMVNSNALFWTIISSFFFGTFSLTIGASALGCFVVVAFVIGAPLFVIYAMGDYKNLTLEDREFPVFGIKFVSPNEVGPDASADSPSQEPSAPTA